MISRLYSYYTKYRSEFYLRMALRKIDRPKFAIIQQKYKDDSPYPGHSKYLDIDKYMKQNLITVIQLGLHRSKPIRILDLGTGCGYFPYLCQYFGHSVQALDLDEISMYNDITQFLGLARKVWRIEPFVPLPDLGPKFDLVTAFSICFNNHNRSDLWGPQEWHFFLNDLVQHHMHDTGKIYFRLNQEKGASELDPSLKEFFIQHNGLVTGWEVTFPSVQSFTVAHSDA